MRRTVLLVAVVSLLGGCSATAPSATAVETAPPPLITLDDTPDDTRAASEPPVVPSPTPPILVVVARGDADLAGFDALVAAVRALPDVTVTVAATADDWTLALDDLTAPPDVVVVGTGTRVVVGTQIEDSPLVAAASDAARLGLPALTVSAGGNSSSDFAVAARLAAEEIDDHRADYSSGTNLDQVVVNLNIPSCAPGTMVRGVVDVPVASESPADSGAPAFDCGSTMIDYQDDVSALAVGYATRSTVTA